jgi:hypothetical protein
MRDIWLQEGESLSQTALDLDRATARFLWWLADSRQEISFQHLSGSPPDHKPMATYPLNRFAAEHCGFPKKASRAPGLTFRRAAAEFIRKRVASRCKFE